MPDARCIENHAFKHEGGEFLGRLFKTYIPPIQEHDLMRQSRSTFTAVAVAALLAACGGSSTNPSISGLAATGAALANASVTAKCSSGPTVTGMTFSDGSFSIQLTGSQAMPCLVQVSNGAVTLHGFAVDAGRINVTPLTDWVIAKAIGVDDAVARGGSGILNSRISGSSATLTRARGPRMQDEHEQKTSQEPLADLQG